MTERMKLRGATYGGAGTEEAPAPAAPAAPEAAAPAAPAAAAAPPSPPFNGGGNLAQLQAAAKAAGEAAYQAYNQGHGKRPAANAGELMAKAAQARAALAAAGG